MPMLEGYWLLTEGAAVAVPAVATAAYALRGRRRLHGLLREALFWDGGQPVSLATIFAELNGETDLTGALREAVGGSGPLKLAELERAVRLFQASPTASRELVLDQATEAVLLGAGKAGNHEGRGIHLMAHLSEAYDQLGFFGFAVSLNEERPASLPTLLPVEGVLAGGLPMAGAAADEQPIHGSSSGVMGVLRAIGQTEGGVWLPTVVKAVEDLVRERQVKKFREAYFRTLKALGQAVGEDLRRQTLAGQQVRRNVYSPLDAYRNLQARVAAHRRKGKGLKQRLVPGVEDALWHEFGQSLTRATAVVTDKCRSLERLLMGKQGVPLAGEVLFKHRQDLLAGVAPDAFPVSQAEAAFQEYCRAREAESS